MRRLVAVLLVSIAGTAVAQVPASDESADHRRIVELERQLYELQHPPAPPPKPQPRDVREPPFGEFDFSWLNGNNSQPPSLLTVGPLTWSLYIDAYYAYQFHAPIDHTIFPGTVAARHNEISFNLGMLGVEVSGLDGPIGRIYIQYGSNVETTAGQDPTVTRGYFLSASVFKYIAQAAVGWHFHALHGINAELGIFPSYVGLESYLPQENWSYTHAFVSDATPYYFFGLRTQIFATQRLKVELWLVNGWQTFGQWHEGRAGGYFINWRPREWLSLVNSIYLGQEVLNDPSSLRVWSDNNAQLRYYKGRHRRAIHSAAVSLTADAGLEHRGAPTPDGWMGGLSLANRVAWTTWLATTVRADVFYDQRGTLIQQLPLGDPYQLPAGRSYLLGGVSITNDFSPSPWVLFRLEYSHRESSQPYFSGHGGITGPSGIQGPAIPTFAPDLQNRDDRVILNATLRL
ncbi:MAG: outer membrane protein [bacterium]|nr:outer membrane protein [bacterium]